MKQAAIEAVAASKPTAVYYGTVTGENPLTVNVEQKMTLTAAQLVLTSAVADHYVDIEVAHQTENDNFMNGQHIHAISDTYTGGGSSDSGNLNTTHHHEYKGRKRIMIYNGLHTGERVILLRMQEGQRFLVLDRVSEHITEGEWLA